MEKIYRLPVGYTVQDISYEQLRAAQTALLAGDMDKPQLELVDACMSWVVLNARTAGEIEITPEMVKSGLGAYSTRDPRYEESEGLVIKVFEAMSSRSNQDKPLAGEM